MREVDILQDIEEPTSAQQGQLLEYTKLQENLFALYELQNKTLIKPTRRKKTSAPVNLNAGL
jgi:hypothetical protein